MARKTETKGKKATTKASDVKKGRKASLNKDKAKVDAAMKDASITNVQSADKRKKGEGQGKPAFSNASGARQPKLSSKVGESEEKFQERMDKAGWEYRKTPYHKVDFGERGQIQYHFGTKETCIYCVKVIAQQTKDANKKKSATSTKKKGKSEKSDKPDSKE